MSYITIVSSEEFSRSICICSMEVLLTICLALKNRNPDEEKNSSSSLKMSFQIGQRISNNHDLWVLRKFQFAWSSTINHDSISYMIFGRKNKEDLGSSGNSNSNGCDDNTLYY